MDNDTKKTIRTLGYLSTIGLSMAFAIGLGAGIGFWLDKKLGTGPWLFFVFFGLGIVAAFRNLYIMYKKAKDL